MAKKSAIILASGPVTVAVRRFRDYYTCTALQFDIVGTGKTKGAALRQLQELVGEYLLAVIELVAQGKKIRFFNPSDAEEWNRAQELRDFKVSFALQTGNLADAPPADIRFDPNLRELARYKDSIESVELVPA